MIGWVLERDVAKQSSLVPAKADIAGQKDHRDLDSAISADHQEQPPSVSRPQADEIDASQGGHPN